jgi:lipoyl(octanoyl) transferase
VTWHGFALNVGADLSPFERITPCGLDGVRMTSLAAEGVATSVDAAAAVAQRAFARVFGYASSHPFETRVAAPVREVPA